MMNVTYGGYQEEALRVFTDRETPRAAFWNRYRQVEEQMQSGISPVSVLHYYGVGGIGKSTLLKKLTEELHEQVQNPLYVQFDFCDAQDSRTVLTRLAEELTTKYHFSFPQFDIANITYAKRTNTHFNERDIQQFCQKSPFLRLAVKTLDVLTGSVATKIFEVADDALAEFRNYLKRNKNNIQKMDHIDLKELYKHLPYYFALDMQYNLQDKNQPFVVFLDTYEMLVNEISGLGNPLYSDLWLRDVNGLIQRIPNVLWVIGGRNKLKWEDFNKDWCGALEQHLLGSLSEEDSDSFLTSSGVSDALLRKQLCQLTGGTPLYLNLCMDTYDELVGNGETPTVDVFGKTPEELIESFVRYMDDRTQDFVYFLVCLGRWNDEIVTKVAEKVFSPFPYTLYQKIRGLSFVSETEQAVFAVHQTVGQVLEQQCPVSLKKKTGQALLECFSRENATDDIYDTQFGMRLQHLLRAGMLLDLSREEIYRFYCEHIRPGLQEMIDACLFEQAEMIFRPFFTYATEQKDDILYVAACIDHCYFEEQKGNWKESLAQKEHTYREAVRILGEDHQETLVVLGNIATALEDFGRIDEAIDLHRKIAEKRTLILGENHPQTILARSLLAESLCNAENPEEALRMQEEVIQKRIEYYGENHAITLQAIGNKAMTLYKLMQYDDALQLKEEVLKKRRQYLGENHPDTIVSVNNLSCILCDMGRKEEALGMQRDVLRIQKEIYGENHPITLTVRFNIALTLMDLGEKEKALEIHQEVLRDRIEILGENHPKVFASRRNVVRLLRDLEHQAEALPQLEELVSQATAVLGVKHPETMLCRSSFAKTLVLMKKYGRAELVLRALLRDCEEMYGLSSRNTKDTARGYAITLVELRRPDKARQIVKKYGLNKK